MSSRSGRVVSTANGLVAAGLVAVLAAVALVVKPPAPPGIAEFAPQATKPITKAPLGQSAESGEGAGGVCAVGQPCAPGQVRASGGPTALPTPSGNSAGVVAGVPSSLQCFTWPDGAVTQTFDRQSPPCIASWPEAEGGNGGSTAMGVTGSEIRVVLGEAKNVYESGRPDQKLADFFNNHFQFYGRKLRIDWLTPPADVSSAQGQLALAKEVASKKPFAAFSFSNRTYTSATTYTDALADRGVIVVDGTPYFGTSKQAARNEPFQWSYGPHLDVIERNLAEFACSALVGQPATFAGPALRQTTRKFAALYTKPTGGVPPPETAPLREGLASCGADLTLVEYDTDRGPSDQAELYLKLERDGVTSVVLLADGSYTSRITNPPNTSYQPEWILPGLNRHDEVADSALSPQRSQIFGLATEDLPVPAAEQPTRRAIAEMGGAGDYYGYDNLVDLYHQLLLVASGIQMAGPHLTPETFAEALWSTEFPNPGAASAPHYQGTVDFRPHSYSMVSDFGLKWFSSAETRPGRSYQGLGGFCFVGNGRRWSLGSWPEDDPGLFDDGRGC